ncbi:hypothetical protein GJ698_14990 [Pseudoduganella sp. FT26W]|uniref:Uncharacterized protein n=1 Tax=Duganella aquatilis TaxID=2666082 RepID=A0A844DC58_9BURK|nr:YdaS family helix-turn-helix protein [Duganella aquatilis]MRW85390.1 hypothetical protein [Duganella aquatilis]
MTLSEYFALARGNQLRLAEVLNEPQANLSRWATGTHPLPAEKAVAIEHATAGTVTRKELFPDTWATIWPELAAEVRPHACTNDHAAELRRAITETRIVFESEPAAGDALNYLESVLAAAAPVPAQTRIAGGGGASITEETLTGAGAVPVAGAAQHASSTTADQAAAAMAAESAQLVADAERTAAGAAARAAVDPLALLSREVFSLSDKLQQPADLVVQLMVLAELRGLRTEHKRMHRTTSMVVA